MGPPAKNIKIVLRSSSLSVQVPSSKPSLGGAVRGKRGRDDSQQDRGFSLSSEGGEEDEEEGEGEEEEEEDEEDEDSTESVSPKRLTARQKAIQQREDDDENDDDEPPEPVDHLTTKKGKKRDLTEEEELLESEKLRKRRHQRDQKLEESQRATIERLLQKQSSRSKKSQKSLQTLDDLAENESDEPTNQSPAVVALSEQTVKFVSNKEGERLVVPAGSFQAAAPSALPTVVTCSAKGCKRPKACSSVSGKPICCSQECYKRLMASK